MVSFVEATALLTQGADNAALIASNSAGTAASTTVVMPCTYEFAVKLNGFKTTMWALDDDSTAHHTIAIIVYS
ncbi:MAG: hypothetical protein OXE99_08945 [Cellvibrionales bacterium]|nr:hypothetical protein [Cellvibrionales bacterium]